MLPSALRATTSRCPTWSVSAVGSEAMEPPSDDQLLKVAPSGGWNERQIAPSLLRTRAHVRTSATVR